ncbi:MAG: hypothetical protein AB7R90_15525 [Reyranellaceae bacterium]
MISGRELAFGLLGAWRLVRNDAAGLQYFDRSPQGALRSFRVMALVAPAYAVLLLMQFDAYGVAEIGLRQVLLGAGIYVIDWLLFPVILLRLGPALGRQEETPGYVAANNWAQILIYALALFVGAVAAMLPEALAATLNFAMLGLVALMQYRLLRHTLRIAPAQAGLLVVAYLSLGVVLNVTLYELLLSSAATA